MKRTNQILVLSFIFIVACSTKESPLAGKWIMHQVFQSGEDVTVEHNPESDRWIEFKPDGTFESGGSPYGRNTGRYKMDRSSGELFIDSDSGEDDDSRWTVKIDEDQMIWQGLGAEWAEQFKLVHIRAN